MPFYRNDTHLPPNKEEPATPRALTFDVGDEHFRVAPGEVCEISKRYEYVVASRGLPLKRVTHEELAGARVVESTAAVQGRPRPAPAGVLVGEAARERTEDTDEDEGDDEHGPESAGSVAAQLAKQGVRLPDRTRE